jgi:hypothetical protein
MCDGILYEVGERQCIVQWLAGGGKIDAYGIVCSIGER